MLGPANVRIVAIRSTFGVIEFASNSAAQKYRSRRLLQRLERRRAAFESGKEASMLPFAFGIDSQHQVIARSRYRNGIKYTGCCRSTFGSRDGNSGSTEDLARISLTTSANTLLGSAPGCGLCPRTKFPASSRNPLHRRTVFTSDLRIHRF